MALFGRKINHAEHQLVFIEMLRLISEGRIGPEEAVHAYHAALRALGITPRRSLEEDLQLTDPVLRADRTGRRRVQVQTGLESGAANDRATATSTAEPGQQRNLSVSLGAAGEVSTPLDPAKTASAPSRIGPLPRFDSMAPEERRDYHLERLRRRFG
ncbi:MAG: hypothetical protein RMN51_11940 [Verrucomicrobiota bacterium]|nr:hypothetical protein [Limisphaera sp.]MDW8382801.1 hypothetical protein [Verrucomicrobiota bacterium]